MPEKKNKTKQEKINEAADKLSDAVNDMSVNYMHVAEGFLKVHPYLLNLIAKGICQAAKIRQSDGRVSIKTLKNILEGK